MDIAIYEDIPRDELMALLRRVESCLRDELQIRVTAVEQIEALPDEPPEPRPELLIWIDEDADEPFSVLVGVGFDPERTPEGYDGITRLAGWISTEVACRTVCDGSDHGDDDSPFWCILWDRGKAFLADDAEMDPDDDEPPGELRIVRPLPDLQPPRGPSSIAQAFRQI